MSFQVRAGEILGLAGVQGNGQTELCEALLGLRPIASGHIRLDGRDLTHSTPRQRLHAGVAYIPEDRQEDGLVGDFSVADNLVLDIYDRPPFASGIACDLGAIASNAAERVEEFDVRTQSARGAGGHAVRRQPAEGHPGPGDSAGSIKVLVASQPTRGLDVGSIEFVHRRIVAAARRRRGRAASSRPSSTRSTRWPTGSRSCTRAGSPASGRPRSPVEELGLLMAGSDTDPAPEPRGAAPAQPVSRSGAGRSGRAAHERAGAARSPGAAVSAPRPATATTQTDTRAPSAATWRPVRQAIIDRVLEGNSVTVTILAIFTAMVHRRPAERVHRHDGAARVGQLLLRAGRRAISQAWDTAVGAYVGAVRGLDLQPAHGGGAVPAGLSTAVHNGYLARCSTRSRRPASRPRRCCSPGWRSRCRSGPACSTSARRASSSAARSWPPTSATGSACRPSSHVIVCVIGGFVGGAVLGWVVGELKARTGAHEVITTIMLNYIMDYLLSFLLGQRACSDAGPDRPDQPGHRRQRAPAAPVRRRRCGSTRASCSRWPARSACGGCCTGPRSASSSAPSARTRARPGWPA